MSFSPVLMLTMLLAVGTLTLADEAVQRTLWLGHSENNPRNSEGSFVTLKDGRVMFVFTHFTGQARGSDHDPSYLTARFSADAGVTWTSSDAIVLENEGKLNTMSVSMLRLADGRIAMTYCLKNSLQDCRPYMRFSSDEARTWSPRVQIVPDDRTSYYVLNNDRVVQLASGRLIVPLARHDNPVGGRFDASATLVCYLSDDAGKTWRASRQTLESPTVIYQEPGVVELKDGRLMMFIRTGSGSQFISHSADGGETWAQPAASTQLLSPTSPASIKRIPATGDLLAVWNHKAGVDINDKTFRNRTPFTAATSRDEGKTWTHTKNIAADPNGWYCYTAITFVGDHVLLGHCAGDRSKTIGLADTAVTRLPVKWLYQ